MQEQISFGVWLRKQRRALDLSRQALADQVGCAEITLRRIESGTLKPSKELASILLEKLDIPETAREQWILFARGLSGFPSLSGPVSNRSIPNLPASLTTFIGREREQSDVIRLIAKYRLVTLTGTGGIGKTRLSIVVGEQVWENYVDGVWLVELASIPDPLLLPRIMAIAIGLRDEPQRPVTDMLADYLYDKEILILLDNCEHLLDACAQLAETVLKRCPGLKILATSREALGIMGEAVYRVPSLELPDSQQLIEKFRDYESIRLFEERAQLGRIDFSMTLENASSVAEICSRLDGIPLAIELAAARISTFSTEQIATRLQKSFDLLTTGNRTALPRHQTLQAVIDWSYELLSPAEQTLFRRLSIFVNGWTLAGAESIGSDANIKSDAILNLLYQLINKSLVLTQEEHEKTRYRMLETIRQYANEKLIETRESEELRDRHLEYFLHLAESAATYLMQSEQMKWLSLLDADYENFRLALEWSLNKENPEPSLRFCTALGRFWKIRCYWVEGLSYLKRALAKPSRNEGADEKAARARALYTHADLEWHLGNIEEILASAQASLVLASELSDRRDIAIARFYVGVALSQRSADEQALSLLEQSLADFEALNEPLWQAVCFMGLGYPLVRQAKLKLHDVCSKYLELARQTGDRWILADALTSYAEWLFRVGRLDEARQHVQESSKLYKQLGAENANTNSFLLGDIAWISGDTQTAKSLFIELYKRLSLLGEKRIRSHSVGKLGFLEMEEGNLNQAQTYLEEALAIQRDAGWKSEVIYYLIELGNLFYLQGEVEAFKRNFRESLSFKDYLTEFQKSYILIHMLCSLYPQKPECAARLLGIIGDPERKSDFPRNPVEKLYCVRAEAYARKVLGKAAYESAFGAGQKMSVDEGLDLALMTAEEM